MPTIIRQAAMAALLALGLAACESSNGPMTLTAADNGSTIELKAGDEVDVVLTGNQTTGYTWELVSVNTAVLAQRESPDYTLDSDMTGSGGHWTFRFRAIAAGQTTLLMAYRRSWDHADTIATFSITAQVSN